MTNPPPVLLTPEASPRRLVNGWELALWILGILLIVVSAVLMYDYTQFFVTESNNLNVGVTVTFASAFAQTSAIYAPAVLTSAVVCIALAILMRGLDVNARRRDLQRPVPGAPAASPIDGATSPSEPEVPAPRLAPQPEPHVPLTPTDYSAFRKPTDEHNDGNG